MNKYNLEGINLPIKKRWMEKIWEKKQFLSIFCMQKGKQIYPAHVSRHNWNREKQIILLMIPIFFYQFL